MARPKKEVNVVSLFRGPRVLTLAELCRVMGASRSTVLRRLDEHGYHSSDNQNDEFLTIPEFAAFDTDGLWRWKSGVLFTKMGIYERARGPDS